MDFNTFINLVPKIANLPLPGEDAHLLMAPPERRELMKSIDMSLITPRRAAVMMLAYPKDDATHFALIKRNSYNGVHSSQVAFPGGKIEPDDASPLYAALRETEEEIGVAREKINFVTPFSEVYIPPSNFFVAPFLGYCEHKPLFIPDPREVSGIVEMSLQELLEDSNCVLQTMNTSYSESIAVPVFKLAGNDVWGATAMMLSELREVLKTAIQ